jgi:hypothetical protein
MFNQQDLSSYGAQLELLPSLWRSRELELFFEIQIVCSAERW